MNIWFRRMTVFVLVLIFAMSGCTPIDMEAEPEVDSAEPEDSSLETDLAYTIMGGFFYTSQISLTGESEEEDFLSLRKAKTEELKEAISETAQQAEKVSSGLGRHEDILFEYMDKIENDNNATVQMITQEVLANRTLLESYEKQIEVCVSSDASKEAEAAVDTLEFEVVCMFAEAQKRYIPWLMGSTEAAAALLENTDKAMAGELVSSCAAIYTDGLNEDLISMLSLYNKAGEIYIQIISADYYINEYYLEFVENKLGDMDKEETRDADDIEELFSEVERQDREPEILITPRPEFDNSSFAKKAAAVLEGTQSINETDGAAEKIMLKQIVNDTDMTNAIRDSYGKYIEDGAGGGLRSSVLIGVDTQNEGDPTVQLNVAQKKLNAEEMQKGTEDKTGRQEIIKIITTAQGALNTFSFFGVDKYSIIIRALNTMITKFGSMNEEQMQNIKDLINNDLEQILGDNKDDFVDKLTNTAAQEMLDAFDGWKQNTQNFSSLNFTRNDIIRLINALGVYVPLEEAVLEENEELQNWSGTVKYTETTNEFQDGAVITAGISNDFSGDFLFRVLKDELGAGCVVDKVMNYDIENLSVTNFVLEDSKVTILLEGTASDKNIYNFVWEGTTNSHGNHMEGTCFIHIVYTDEFLATIDNPQGFALQSSQTLTGTWQADLK